MNWQKQNKYEAAHVHSADDGIEIMRAVAKLPYVVEHKGALSAGRSWEIIAAFNSASVAEQYANDNFDAAKRSVGEEHSYGYRMRPMLASDPKDIVEFIHQGVGSERT